MEKTAFIPTGVYGRIAWLTDITIARQSGAQHAVGLLVGVSTMKFITIQNALLSFQLSEFQFLPVQHFQKYTLLELRS